MSSRIVDLLCSKRFQSHVTENKELQRFYILVEVQKTAVVIFLDETVIYHHVLYCNHQDVSLWGQLRALCEIYEGSGNYFFIEYLGNLWLARELIKDFDMIRVRSTMVYKNVIESHGVVTLFSNEHGYKEVYIDRKKSRELRKSKLRGSVLAGFFIMREKIALYDGVYNEIIKEYEA